MMWGHFVMHVGVRSSPLPRAPARDPDGKQMDLGFDADAG